MVLDFVQFIQNNTSFTTQQEADMLDHFCAGAKMPPILDEETGEETPATVLQKKAFFNATIQRFVTEHINIYRKKQAQLAAIYTEFEME